VDGDHQGYRAGEGAYDNYVRHVDPLGEEIKGAVAGDGLSAMGGESGFTGAYTARMRSLPTPPM
jgi:hypothetical protein